MINELFVENEKYVKMYIKPIIPFFILLEVQFS